MMVVMAVMVADLHLLLNIREIGRDVKWICRRETCVSLLRLVQIRRLALAGRSCQSAQQLDHSAIQAVAHFKSPCSARNIAHLHVEVVPGRAEID